MTTDYPSTDYQPSLDTVNHDPLRLWLGGLPPKTTEYAILQLTRQFGPLADFNFPVRRFGEGCGSTVGYCFVTYKSLEDAEKALKGLDGLNFHGYTLVARQAHPTRDELSMIQLANKEAISLRIAEQAKIREAELAARLVQMSDDPMAGQLTDTVAASMQTVSSTITPLSSATNVVSTEPPGTSTLSWSTTSDRPISTWTSAPKSDKPLRVDKRATIRKIELALKQLENAPIGGAALLQPSSATQRPVIPPGILAERFKDGHSHESGTKRFNSKSFISGGGPYNGTAHRQRRHR